MLNQPRWDGDAHINCFPGCLCPTVLGVTVYAVDPGMVNTEITRHFMSPLMALTKTFSFFLKTPAEGAYTSVYCAVEPESQLLTGGFYK